MLEFSRTVGAGACFTLALFTTAAAAETIEGSLDKGDTLHETRGGYADTFEIEVEEGQLLVVELASEDFDTLLILTAPDGSVYENDDDQSVAGFHTNSRLAVHAPEGGTWQVTATSFGEDTTGDYTVEHSTLAVQPFIDTEGELTEEDNRSPKTGEFYDAHVVPVEAGQTLMIALNSDDFDAYLTVYLPDGTMLTNDDAQDFNALVIADIGEAGQVTIIATSAMREEVGDYQLVVLRAE